MKAKTLFYNGRVHTQADRQVVDSMVIYKGNIVAVGNRLESDPDFKSYSRIDLKGRTVIPGLVDAHTHFYNFALNFNFVSLDGVDSLGKCLTKVRKFAAGLGKNSWVLGNGYSPDRFRTRQEPDRLMLDKITGGRPAFIFSKDMHSAWVNGRALEIAGISTRTPEPSGGRIVRFVDGTPSGILREIPGYGPVIDRVPKPSQRVVDRCVKLALEHAYKKGVTGVHSFDGPEGFTYLADKAQVGKLGLRVNYYPHESLLGDLEKTRTTYGTGTDFFRIAGVKIFSDGALGSQTALCFNKYLGSKDSFGIEVASTAAIQKTIRRAGRLGLPCAIHAIGDKAIDNVLTAFEKTPRTKSGARHRIEHLQMIRRKDLARVKQLNVVASMQPSHCPSDIHMIRKYWGKRGRNAYICRTVIDKKIDLAFGSDVPIEPLDPLAGIAAAVRRARPGSRDVFYPEQRVSAVEALHAFTVGSAVAAGQDHCRGYLLPDYPADFVVLDRDITRIAPSRIYDTRVLATVIDGTVRHLDRTLRW
ncbi:MAG: amidohydrolase [bacterium]|nr:amidohydrolase [bacterium]